MNLTARQRSFLEIASHEEGFCPWAPPPKAPILRNEEIQPLLDGGLIEYDGSIDAWLLTMSGRLALAPVVGGASRQGERS